MGFLNNFKKAAQDIASPVTDMATEFDPTNPDANYSQVTRTAGDIAANVVMRGTAGTAFSDASQGIQDLNEATDNTFTTNNIWENTESAWDTVSDMTSFDWDAGSSPSTTDV